MRLSLGNWLIDLLVSPQRVAEATARRYAPFREEPSREPDLTVRAEFLPSDPRSDPQHSLWDARLVACDDGYLLDPPGRGGTISPVRHEASLRVSSPDPGRDLEYFFRVALAVLAFHHGGLLVHGAAVVANGRGRLFIGQSGSGKSTVVALSSQGAALGDDLVLLRQHDGRWMVYGTPFWNWETQDRAAQTQSAPLAGIYKLVKAPEVRLAPMSLASATAELVANCPVVNDVEDSLPDLLTACRRLATAVPVNRLLFRKDATFWRLFEPEEAVL